MLKVGGDWLNLKRSGSEGFKTKYANSWLKTGQFIGTDIWMSWAKIACGYVPSHRKCTKFRELLINKIGYPCSYI